MIDIALKNIFRQKTRSLLTILGIAMGVGLILALGSLGQGMQTQIEDSFGELGGYIDVSLSSQDEDTITEEMIADIKYIEGVQEAIPIGEYQISRGGGMRGFGRMMSRMGGGSSMQFTGISPENLDALVGKEINADEGSKLDSSDDGSLVVVLGYSTAEDQLLNVGDEIEYERRKGDGDEAETVSYYFDVVGILEETGDSEIDDAAFVPLATMQEIEDDEDITRLKVKVEDVSYVESVTDEISREFDELRAFSMLEMVRRLEETLATTTQAIYAIGAVSIIVGAIGVMNTMIMSVMERRREIGVMKALGATTHNVLSQVLQESAVLSLIGGVVGVGLGKLAAGVIESNTNYNALLSIDLILFGLVFSIILGIGAGIYPAWAASRLDPIEVLRYE